MRNTELKQQTRTARAFHEKGIKTDVWRASERHPSAESGLYWEFVLEISEMSPGLVPALERTKEERRFLATQRAVTPPDTPFGGR